MRKRLLRSRSGFEKPESREEAIMQNILGASNVLEPSESNIEEILKSILYNIPYTKEAEFEIEKILLAIKNNGTYDGECGSRDLKILFAILNDLDYTEEAESRIEELFIEWLHQRSPIKVLEGVPPLTFTSRGLPLINYLIEGNTVQTGTPTPDNPIMPQGTGELEENVAIIDNQSDTITNFYYKDVRISDELPAGTYTISFTMNSKTGNAYASSLGKGSTTVYQADVSEFLIYNTPANINRTITLNSNACIWARFLRSATPATFSYSISGIAIVSGDKPYGQYKIPILSASTTTPVYLGEVESTRRVKKQVVTISRIIESGTPNMKIAVVALDTSLVSPRTALSTVVPYGNASTPETFYFINANNIGMVGAVGDTDEQITAKYEGSILYYGIAKTTGIVNEPLMKIREYADTLSMEQAGVQIPTNNGTTVIDVDTTVKPSNIYIKYK